VTSDAALKYVVVCCRIYLRMFSFVVITWPELLRLWQSHSNTGREYARRRRKMICSNYESKLSDNVRLFLLMMASYVAVLPSFCLSVRLYVSVCLYVSACVRRVTWLRCQWTHGLLTTLLLSSSVYSVMNGQLLDTHTHTRSRSAAGAGDVVVSGQWSVSRV